MKIISILIFILVIVTGAYFWVSYTYEEKNPSKIKPIIFSEDDTIQNTLSAGQGKDKEKKNTKMDK